MHSHRSIYVNTSIDGRRHLLTPMKGRRHLLTPMKKMWVLEPKTVPLFFCPNLKKKQVDSLLSNS